MLSSWYDFHAAASFDKQLALSALVEGLDWTFHRSDGCLAFGERLRWRVQLLGTECDASCTWLWAWANPSASFSKDLIGAACLLRLLGEEQGIPEWTEPQLPLGEVDGHYLAMIASGVCQAGGYYRAPYDGGAAFLLIVDGQLPRSQDRPVERLATIFPQALSVLPLRDHRAAWLGYLHYYGLTPRAEGNIVRVEESGQSVLTATFDEDNRLIQLDSVVLP